MADDEKNKPPQPPTSTNDLLAAILQVDQQILTTEQESLKVQKESRDLLKQLVSAISGEGHVYTVFVQQLAKGISKELKK